MPKVEKSVIQDVSKMTLAQVKKAYKALSEQYTKITDGAYCARCDTFKKKDDFYVDIHNVSGRTCVCKECAYKVATNVGSNKDDPNPDKNSVIEALRLLNKPFFQSLYDSSMAETTNMVTGKTKSNVWSAYIKNVCSLTQYYGMEFKDSVFDETDEEGNTITLSKKAKEETIKRFGDGYNDAELKFLYNEYKDWTSRYECNTKSMELIFQRICSIELEIRKAQKTGKPTDKLDKSLQEMLDSGGLKPKQSTNDSFTDALTFGQLIEKWEQEEVIPQPEGEFKDPDGIGRFIRINFKGALARALGLDNGYSKEYDDYMAQYTVTKPEVKVSEVDGEKVSTIYEQIFGSDGEL